MSAIMPSGEQLLPLAVLTQIDQLCDRFESAWRQAATPEDRPQIEQYLEGIAEPGRTASLRELLALELELRVAAGETLSPEEMQERFPNASELLADVVPEYESVPDFVLQTPQAGVSTEEFAPAAARPSTGALPPHRPRQFGDFELLDCLGRGGMGIVYRAHQRSARRSVALKMIRLDRLEGLPEERRLIWLKRFETEAHAASRIEHEFVVPVYEVGALDGQLYYAMRYIEGKTLADFRGEHPLTNRQAANYLEKVARAVHHAHTLGVLHRDLKPRNILVDASDRPFVTDFGLAKYLEGVHHLTQSNEWLGTPSYMAPEQACNPAGVTAASDVYSLGATLYDLITGRPPFQAATLAETLHQALHQDPVAPRLLNPAIDRDLETIALKCLCKEPARRYPSAAELADDLRRYLGGEPIRARPVSRWERSLCWARRRPLVSSLLASVLIVAALGLGGVLWHWRQAVLARANETEQRHRAERALDEKDALLYFRQIALARLHWGQNDIERAEQILDQCLPGAGEPDRRGWEWYYLKRQCHADLMTLAGHNNWVNAVACSPNGQLIASVAGHHVNEPGSGELRIWDAATGRVRWSRSGLPTNVAAVAFSPDGGRLAFGGALKVCRADDGQDLLDVGKAVTGVAFSPDGRYLVGGSADGTVTIWDAQGGQGIRTMHRAEGSVTSVAIHPTCSRLVAAYRDGSLTVWDYATGRELRTWRAHPLMCTGAAFRPDGRRLATAGAEPAVRVWDADTGREVQVLRGHTGWVFGVCFSPDGGRLASASADRTVRIWDLATGEQQLNLRGHRWGAFSVAFSPDGRKAASGGQGQTVKVWDATRPQHALVCGDPNEVARALAFTNDGQTVTTVSLRGLVGSWDARSGAELRHFEVEVTGPHSWPRADAAIDPTGRLLAAVSRQDNTTVEVWNATDGRPVHVLAGHNRPVTALAFSSDGSRLAAAVEEGSLPGKPVCLKVWDMHDGRLLHTFFGHDRFVVSLAFSPDGRWLASGGVDHTARIWDLTDGDEATVLRGHESTVAGVSFGPDGRLLATTGYLDHTVRLWDVADGQLIRTLQSLDEPSPLLGVAVSPDGRRVAAASADAVQLWDTEAGKEALTLHGPTNPRPADIAFNARVVFSPDGNRLAANNWDGSITVWDATPLAATDPLPSKSGKSPH